MSTFGMAAASRVDTALDAVMVEIDRRLLLNLGEEARSELVALRQIINDIRPSLTSED